MNGQSKLWNQQMWKVIYVSQEQMLVLDMLFFLLLALV